MSSGSGRADVDVLELRDCDIAVLRLCFLRPPPTWIDFGSQDTVEFELTVGVTDDYGNHKQFTSLDLQLQVQVSRPGENWQRVENAIINVPSHPSALGRSCGDHGSCALLTLDGTKTPYHKLKVVLKILPFSQPRGVFRFILSGASDHEVYRDPLDKDGVELRQMLGIRNYPCDSSSTVFLAITSGDVEVRKSVWKGKGPSPSHVSTEKVQTAYRNVSIHGKENAIRMLERAGLNNSTGQRLWDCALGLSFYLSNHPKFLFPPSSVSSAAAVGSPGDEPQTVLQVVELGAGCGLSGLVARWMLSDFESEVDSKVVFTDIQATVDTTLSENLALNSMGPEGPVNVAIPQVLNWGPLSPSDLDRVFSSRKGPFDLTILGSDILYNPESHSILLESLLALMKPRKGSTSQAIIAYKKRTEGDDAFFQLASDAGLEVKMVCDGLMGIEVWRFLCK